MTLGQIGASNPANNPPAIPSLPRPPPLVHYTLENPWPLAIALLLAGFVALVWLNSRGRLGVGVRAAVVGLLFAIAVYAAAALCTTEREALQARTVQLVDLTAGAKTAALHDMLLENVSTSTFGIIPRPQGRAAVLGTIEGNLGVEHPISEHEVGRVQAVIDGPNVARTQVRVWAKFKETGNVPIGAWFRIEWTRSMVRETHSGGEHYGPWRVSGITLMQLDGAGANPDVGAGR